MIDALIYCSCVNGYANQWVGGDGLDSLSSYDNACCFTSLISPRNV